MVIDNLIIYILNNTFPSAQINISEALFPNLINNKNNKNFTITNAFVVKTQDNVFVVKT